MTKSLERSFFVGCLTVLEEDFKFSLVAWDIVCSPIVEGGLGFKKLGAIINRCWGKGYGTLGMKKHTYGDR